MKKSMLPILITLVVLIIPIGFSAEDFEVGAVGGEKVLCPTHTTSLSIPVENVGDSEGSYSVSLSGSAQKWAVSAPTGFSLSPGEVENIYVWITPSSKALPGTYPLSITINGGSAGEKQINYDIIVESCHTLSIEAEQESKDSCPAKMTSYEFTVENTGEYTESYDFSLSGVAKEWSTLSKETVSLASGESDTIVLYVKSPEDELGTYDVTLTAESKDSSAIGSETVSIVVQSCYDYSVDTSKDVYSFCDHTQASIPITLKNKGVESNTYTLTIDGPNWAYLEDETVELSVEEEKEVNLIIFPDYYEVGEYLATIKAFSETGEITQEKEIRLNIRECFSTSLDISINEDTLCEQRSKTYTVSLTNAGEYKEPYNLHVEGPNWATLDKTFIELEAGESEEVTLTVDVPQITGEQTIKVVAKSQEPSETSDSDSLKLDIVSKEVCFSMGVTAELKDVDIAVGEGALVPINVENKGKEEAEYSLEVSGAGASFAQITPSTVLIKAGNSKTAHLYVAIPEEAEQKNYILSVSARLADGTVSSSDTINVNVVEPGQGVDIDNVNHEEEIEPEEVNVPETDEEETNKTGGSFVDDFTEKVGAAFSGVSNQVTGLVSGASAGSFFTDNWKYLVGAVIVVLIIILLWKGLKEEPSEERKKELEEESKDKTESEEKTEESSEDEEKGTTVTVEDTKIADEDKEETTEEEKEDTVSDEEEKAEIESEDKEETTEEEKEDTVSDEEEKPKSKKKSEIVKRIRNLLEEDED